MKVLNLGCGHKVSAHRDVINIDWSIYLRVRSNPILSAFVPIVLRGDRRKRFDSLPKNIFAYDLSRGIPFSANSVDVIFHSNMLEHLDRDVVEQFLLNAYHVLKPGGTHRIVVPDLEYLCGLYMSHVALCDSDPSSRPDHDGFIKLLLEQSVRKEAAGTSLQPPIRRSIENFLLGDARRRGETHQWMYDRINLEELLKQVGYRSVKLMRFDQSGIPNWEQYGLDKHDDGTEYAPGSLYMEACK